jgi:formate hydrogenlyase transcriptional activator
MTRTRKCMPASSDRGIASAVLEQEIAQRQLAEEDLLESEELHRITRENISDAVFLTDDQLAFTFYPPHGDVNLEVTERKRAEAAQHEQRQFEALVGELSARFASLPDTDVGREIAQNLEALGRFLSVDRVSLWETPASSTELRLVHFWRAEGVSPLPPVIHADRLPWVSAMLQEGKPVCVARLSQLPAEARAEREFFRCEGVKSSLVIPLMIGGTVLGALSCGAICQERDWPPELTTKLRLVGEIFGAALARQRGALATAAAFEEIRQLKDRLQAENVFLQEQVKLKYNYGEIVGQSHALQQVLRKVEQVGGTPATVLLLGETGTGKELVARAIHAASPRRDRPMVMVNCAALAPTLVENELFGREKGAYTGALTRQEGRFEHADASTLFLDEIGDLPLETQAKLLRVLQDGQFERLGSSSTLKVDVRVLAATNRDLESAVKVGKFREDLYYRLNVFPIRLPPLRERREDIALLVWAFVREFGRTMGKAIESIPRLTMEALTKYEWPGNIRELRNVIERALIISNGPVLHIELRCRGTEPVVAAESQTMEGVERRHMVAVLERTGWRVSGPHGAAEILGLKPTTLESRMKKLGIRREKLQTADPGGIPIPS